MSTTPFLRLTIPISSTNVAILTRESIVFITAERKGTVGCIYLEFGKSCFLLARYDVFFA